MSTFTAPLPRSPDMSMTQKQMAMSCSPLSLSRSVALLSFWSRRPRAGAPSRRCCCAQGMPSSWRALRGPLATACLGSSRHRTTCLRMLRVLLLQTDCERLQLQLRLLAVRRRPLMKWRASKLSWSTIASTSPSATWSPAHAFLTARLQNKRLGKQQRRPGNTPPRDCGNGGNFFSPCARRPAM